MLLINSNIAGMAGKTSIVKCLEGKMNEKHPPITEQTDGIEILPIRTSSSQGIIHLHCWDFAGQVTLVSFSWPLSNRSP